MKEAASMISPETLSVSKLKQAIQEGGATDTRIDENGCLKIQMHGKTFLATVIGPHQVRFFVPSSKTSPEHSEHELLRIANELNSDIAFFASAYLGDEGTLIYTHPLTVSGGVSEWNIAIAFNEFAMEHAIFEQIVEKRLANSDA